MMKRAHGIDISHHQDFFDVRVNRSDIDFVVIRASNGTTKDRRFDRFVIDIAEVPIKGAYHYFRSEHSPVNPTKPYPWDKQADFFLRLVKDKGFHFYALDFEQAFIGGVADNEGSKKFADDAEKWLWHVAEKTGKPVLLYTNPDKYEHWLAPHGSWMKYWPLWLAQYWDPPKRSKNPGLPKNVTRWAFWQYSADTPPNGKGSEYGVGSDNIDLNVFNGTVDDLHDWLGLDLQKDTDLPPAWPAGLADIPPQWPAGEVEMPADFAFGMAGTSFDVGVGAAEPTWQNMRDAAGNVAKRHKGALYFTWFREADMEDEIKDLSLRPKPYDGTPLEKWNVPIAIRVELQEELDRILDQQMVKPPPPPPPPDDSGLVKLDIPYISQWDGDASSHVADCGPTCLSMIINAKPAPAEAITVDALYKKYLKEKKAQDYTSWREMFSICDKEQLLPKYKAFEKATALENLKKLIRNGQAFVALVNYKPWMKDTGIHFAGYHYVLVTGFDDENVYVHDPLFQPARRKNGEFFRWSNAMFMKGWGGSIPGENPNYSAVWTKKKVEKKRIV